MHSLQSYPPPGCGPYETQLPIKHSYLSLFEEQKLHRLIADHLIVPAERLSQCDYVVEEWNTTDGRPLGIKVRFEGDPPPEVAARLLGGRELNILL
jgi:hypothetical protein